MKKKFVNFIFLLLVLVLLIAVLKYPQLSLKGASEGLLTWFNIVLPSLLPFFIISEILISIGFLEIIGAFLEPVMRFLFNLPGIAAFPFSMSVISGYPTGSRIVASLRKDNLISKLEGEKMLVISNTSGPLFMLGAVTIGMLDNMKLAPLILYPHYLSVITLGLLLRFYKGGPSIKLKYGQKKYNILENIRKNYKSRTSPPIGYVLMDAVKSSMNSLLLVGGFIIFYSVIIEILLKLISVRSNFYVLGLDQNILKILVAGITELTTGCKTVVNTNLPLMIKIALLNFIIGWGGICIHSQALAFLANTDLDGKVYIISKLAHGCLAAIYSILLYKFKYNDLIHTTFLYDISLLDSIYLAEWPVLLSNSIKLAILMVVYLILSSFIMFLLIGIFGKK